MVSCWNTLLGGRIHIIIFVILAQSLVLGWQELLKRYLLCRMSQGPRPLISEYSFSSDLLDRSREQGHCPPHISVCGKQEHNEDIATCLGGILGSSHVGEMISCAPRSQPHCHVLDPALGGHWGNGSGVNSVLSSRSSYFMPVFRKEGLSGWHSGQRLKIYGFLFKVHSTFVCSKPLKCQAVE